MRIVYELKISLNVTAYMIEKSLNYSEKNLRFPGSLFFNFKVIVLTSLVSRLISNVITLMTIISKLLLSYRFSSGTHYI